MRLGRRIAFDPARRKLWSICEWCGRWNESPLEGEQLAEAIAECARVYESSHLRGAHDGISVAELESGEQLVRVDNVPWPMLAAWRYGAVLRARRRRQVVSWVAMIPKLLVAYVALKWVGANTGLVLTLAWWLLSSQLARRRIVCQLRVPGARPITIRARRVDETVLYFGEAGDPLVLVKHDAGDAYLVEMAAVLALQQILPRLNAVGGSASALKAAIELVVSAGEASRETGEVLVDAFALQAIVKQAGRPERGMLHEHPIVVRLALEMAVNESAERLAFTRELAVVAEQAHEAIELDVIGDEVLRVR